jgi:hypothetical protein
MIENALCMTQIPEWTFVILSTRVVALVKVWIAPLSQSVTQSELARLASAKLGTKPEFCVLGCGLVGSISESPRDS